MSLLRTMLVTCDAPECTAATAGDEGKAPSMHTSRLLARRRGWSHRRAGGRFWDLCPAHVGWRPQRTVVDAEALET